MPADDVRELTLEIPITEQPVLTAALGQVQVVQVLEFRSDGFVLLCKGSREGSKRLKEMVARTAFPKIRVSVLNRDKTGSEILQVSGSWVDSIKADAAVRRRVMSFYRTMERAPIYSLGTKFEGGVLKVPIVARYDLIKQLLDGLEGISVPFKVVKLGRLKMGKGSVLDALTLRQRSILKLAHTMGYYDVPRRTRTEELARMLKMDKGTVGEHLRRAEKHVFDSLLG